MPQLAQAQKLIRFLDTSVEDFVSSLPVTEKQIFAKVITLVKKLDVTGDNLQRSVENVRLINQIKQEIDTIISSDAYIGKVKTFLDSFDGVDKLQKSYFSEVTTTFSPPKVLAEIKNQITGDVGRKLTERGIGQTVTDELSSILRLNIEGGGSYADFTEQLRTAILGDKDSGILERYSGQLVTDSINQYSATYSKTVTSDLNLKWFQYTGSLIATSRPFCVACVAKRWIHESEFKSILNGNIDGKKVSLAGVNPETTPENFQILRGGFNCAHQLLPVSEDIVPREIRIALYESKNIPYDENGFAIGEEMEQAVAESESNTMSNNVSKLEEMALESKPQLEEITNTISNENNAQATPVSLKSAESITRKAVDELNGEVFQVQDAVRSTIFTSDKRRLNSIMTELRNLPNTIKSYTQVAAENDLGYSGFIAKIKMNNGLIAEIQANTPEMIFAKEKEVNAIKILGKDLFDSIKTKTGLEGGLGHKYYEEWRLLVARGKLTEAQFIRKKEIERLSKEYYSRFR